MPTQPLMEIFDLHDERCASSSKNQNRRYYVAVPKKLDIVRPELIHLDRRTKRSTSSSSSGPESLQEAHMTLSGLGHHFNLSLLQNSNLIDGKNFVYLFRDQNGSKIISEDSWRDQLKCFYHGTSTSNNYGTERGHGFGSVAALNICTGIVSLSVCSFQICCRPVIFFVSQRRKSK